MNYPKSIAGSGLIENLEKIYTVHFSYAILWEEIEVDCLGMEYPPKHYMIWYY